MPIGWVALSAALSGATISASPQAKIVEEVALRVLEGHLDRQRIDGLDLVDGGEELLLPVGAAFRRRAVERELDHVGGERRAVVELHPVMEMEGVGQAVVRDVPGLGEIGLHGAGLVDAGQALEDVGIGHLVGRRGIAGGRVEPGRFEHHADGDVGARGQRRAGRQTRRNEDGQRRQPECLHGWFSLSPWAALGRRAVMRVRREDDA